MKKKIRHWKVIKSGLSYLDAVNIFTAQAIEGKLYDNLAVRVGERFFQYGESDPMAEKYRPSEILRSDWEVLIPDTDEEAKCEKIRQLSLKHSELQQQVFQVEQNSSLMGPVMLDSLQRMLRRYKDGILVDYIFQEPQSSYAYFALSQTLSHVYWPASSVFVMGDSIDNRAYRAVATCWKEYYPESERAQQLYNMVERDINNARIVSARQQKLQEQDVITVSDIIDLKLPDLNGHVHTLSELRGKVVLLDFHLFSTSESGARILKLRELYERYHDRGLEIYQVSIDQDEHLWKQAVEALPWICVYDPDGESCARYNVSALPEFFIIDRNNALQKRSSQIDDLNAEIERLL